MADGFDNDPIIIDISSDVTDAETARKALAGVDAEINKLRADMNAGTVSFDHYLDQMDQLTARKGALNDWFGSAMTGTAKTRMEFGAFGNKLQQVGGLIDDLQYVGETGIRSVANNVMQISPAAGIALIAVDQLRKNFDSLAESFTGPATKTQAQELEELGKQAKLTALEYDKLNRARRGEKAVDDLREARPEAEGKADKAVKEAIGEAGGRQVVAGGLLQARPDLVNAQGTVPEAQRQLDENRKYIADREKLARDSFDPQQQQRALEDAAAARQKTQGLEQALLDARRATAEQIVANAQNSRDNPGARGQLADVIRANPAAFGPKGGQLLADLDTIGQGKTPDEAKKEAEAAQKKAAKDAATAADDAAEAGYDSIDAEIGDKLDREKELAKNLQGRFNVESARGGGDDVVDEGMIRGELENGGLTEDEARRYAKGVLDRLQDGYNAELAERAGKLGTDTAGAADAIVAEDDRKKSDATEKEARERDQMLNKARQGAEQAERDRADQLKRSLAGTNLTGGSRDALMRALLAGDDPELAARRQGTFVANAATKAGMDPEAARLAGEEHARGLMEKIQDDALAGAMKAPDGPEMKGPEQRDLASFAASLTLGDIPKQSLDAQKQMVELLANIERKTGGPARLGP